MQPTYAPGEAGVIRAVFTVGGREGPQEKTIAVVTDDAPHKPTILTLRVALPESVAIQPASLFWKVGDEAVEKEIEILLADPEKTTLGKSTRNRSAVLHPARVIGKARPL